MRERVHADLFFDAIDPYLFYSLLVVPYQEWPVLKGRNPISSSQMMRLRRGGGVYTFDRSWYLQTTFKSKGATSPMISEDALEKLAWLARLEIDRDFAPVVLGHVNAIVGYVERLGQVDTRAVEPMSHAHGAVNVLREDVVQPVGSTPPATPLGTAEVPVQEMLPTQALLENAPKVSGFFLHVPLIVE
jgi:aspartyl-tRNA(Asn)/glutamyl-tRNA(Gln) amidotransferase subunit C